MDFLVKDSFKSFRKRGKAEKGMGGKKGKEREIGGRVRKGKKRSKGNRDQTERQDHK